MGLEQNVLLIFRMYLPRQILLIFISVFGKVVYFINFMLKSLGANVKFRLIISHSLKTHFLSF